MHCLTVIYPLPENPDAFKKYYAETHIPLAQQLPGLKSHSYGYPMALGEEESNQFCIFQALFEDAAAMGRALESEIGQKVAADVPNYSPDGASLVHFEVEN